MSSDSSSSSSPEPELDAAILPTKKHNIPDDAAAEMEPADDPPPLSHAEKRRQKRRAKEEAEEVKDEGESAPSKKRKLADGFADRGPRQNSVWVGNLHFRTMQDDLRTFFDGCGEITRINLPTKSGKPGGWSENRGFAYVDFATPDAKTIAITLSEKPLNGRKLLIKDGNDFSGRPTITAPTEGGVDGEKKHSLTKYAQKVLQQQRQPAAPTLFLGNLSFETTEESIRAFFDAHRIQPKSKPEDPKPEEPENWIRKVRMGTFEDSGLCKGFAFIDFSSIENATTALTNPKNQRLDGRELKIEYASADAVRRGASRPLLPSKYEANSDRLHKPRRKLDARPRVKAAPTTETSAHGLDDQAPVQEERNDYVQEGRKSRDVVAEGGRHKGPRFRPKPGAALALAKRQSAAIVPIDASKKIVF